MPRHVYLPALAAAFLLCPSPAHAGPSYFIAGIGGVTVQTVTSSAIGGNGGASLGKYADVFGELGRMTDVLPKADLTAITANGNALSTPIGTAGVVGNIPALYGLAGLRLRALPNRRITPFVGFGAGVAHLKNELAVTANGNDISAKALTTPVTMITSERDAIVALDAGLSIKAGDQGVIALGYRFNDIRASAQRINTGYVFGEVRVVLKK